MGLNVSLADDDTQTYCTWKDAHNNLTSCPLPKYENPKITTKSYLPTAHQY